MKVSYIKCDICDQKIEKSPSYKYISIVLVPDPLDPLRSYDVGDKLDICGACFGLLKEWVKTEMDKKKEGKDGPST